MNSSPVKQTLFRLFYKNILKPLLFLFDPENIHDRMIALGERLGHSRSTQKLTARLLNYQNPSLRQTIAGIFFKNPIGLAAGFDKDAHLTQILPSVGFGFAEIGSITEHASPGNAKPRLWRLKKSQSLLVHYGLKNDGGETIAKRLEEFPCAIPIGTSIAKTNCPVTVGLEAGIADYVACFKRFVAIGDYFTINISCPNAYGGQPFTDAKSFHALMQEIDIIPSAKPIFIKLSPDMSLEQVGAIVTCSEHHRVHGFIISNLTKNRSNPLLEEKNIPAVGGMSGKIVENLANELIAYVWKKTGGKKIIIGCGGIFSAADAYKKIKLGASLLQLITGMIFEGPQLIGQINAGLVTLLQKDGYRNISEAVGKETQSI